MQFHTYQVYNHYKQNSSTAQKAITSDNINLKINQISNSIALIYANNEGRFFIPTETFLMKN